jgi:anaerobic sulfite reductase subunit B
MHSLTPNPIQLISYDHDGDKARHFTFGLLDPDAMAAPEPGQFFMLHVPGAGAAPFTFTQPPDSQGIFRALVRQMGSVTSALFDCEPGTMLGVRGPFGKGWEIDPLKKQRVLIIAGGCGLAPLVSLTDHLISEQVCDELVLLYGSRTSAAAVLNPERKRWRNYISVLDIMEDGNHKQNGLTGTPLDALDRVVSQMKGIPDALLLCGPEVMMQAVAEEFVRRGLDPNMIWLAIERRMHCAVGLCGHCYLEHQYACTDGPTYRWDALQHLFAGQPDNGNKVYTC